MRELSPKSTWFCSSKDKLDQAHIQISASTDYARDAPIIGHSTQQTNALEKFSHKDIALEPKLRRVHLLRDLHAPGARISRKRRAHVHEWPKHASKLRSSDRGHTHPIQASTTNFI